MLDHPYKNRLLKPLFHYPPEGINFLKLKMQRERERISLENVVVIFGVSLIDLNSPTVLPISIRSPPLTRCSHQKPWSLPWFLLFLTSPYIIHQQILWILPPKCIQNPPSPQTFYYKLPSCLPWIDFYLAPYSILHAVFRVIKNPSGFPSHLE